MKGVSQFGAAALSDVLRRQPLTPGKLALAWQLAAGAQLSRAARPELLPGGTVRLRTRDARWKRELRRSQDLLRARLAALLDVQQLDLEIS